MPTLRISYVDGRPDTVFNVDPAGALRLTFLKPARFLPNGDYEPKAEQEYPLSLNEFSGVAFVPDPVTEPEPYVAPVDESDPRVQAERIKRPYKRHVKAQEKKSTRSILSKAIGGDAA